MTFKNLRAITFALLAAIGLTSIGLVEASEAQAQPLTPGERAAVRRSKRHRRAVKRARKRRVRRAIKRRIHRKRGRRRHIRRKLRREGRI